MPPKRKAASQKAKQDVKKPKAAATTTPKAAKSPETAKSSAGKQNDKAQQKAAITQFQNITNADRNTAVKQLKSAGWNLEGAVNGFYSGGSSAPSSSARASLNKIFDQYREDAKNAPDSINIEGIMKYFEDIGVSLDGLECFAAMELVQAPSMTELTREGFVNGWSAINCDTLAKQKNHIEDLKKTLPSSKDIFTRTYQHTFQLGKAANQKVVPLETASAFWEVLFTSPLTAVKWDTPSSPWTSWWIEFLNAEWKRSVNKDVWSQTLRFAQQTLEDESISFWNEEASWPSVIDDFVGWVKKEKRGESADGAMAD